MTFDLHTINPYIRVAMPSVLSAGSEIKQRAIYDYELIYIEDGAFTLRYDGRDYRCTAGQFILLRPGISHAFTKIERALSQPHVHFDPVYTEKSQRTPVCFKDLDDFTAADYDLLQQDVFAPYPQAPLIAFSDRETALALFYGIIDQSRPPLVRKAELTQLLALLIAEHFPQSLAEEKTPYNIARQIKDYIDSGHGFSMQLNDFEKQFSYSKYYLERQFRQSFGVGIIAYRNRRRMESAKKLLLTHSVASVAEQLEFTSVFVFSRAFKHHFGFPPSDLLK